jgi:hypothetical protein
VERGANCFEITDSLAHSNLCPKKGMSGTSRYGSKDAGLRAQRIRGAVRAIERATRPGAPRDIYATTNSTLVSNSAAIATIGDLQEFLESSLPGPEAPTIDFITAGNTVLAVGFTKPESGGSPPIIGYEYSIDGGATWSLFGDADTSSPFILSGLTNGVSYPITLRSVSSIKPGASSNSLSGTPATTPGAPTNLVTTPGDGLISVTFSAPVSNGGSAITDYQYSTNNSTWTSTGSATPTIVIVSGTNGAPITVYIRAANSVGAGASASVTETPVTSFPEGRVFQYGDPDVVLQSVEVARSDLIAPGTPYSSASTLFQFTSSPTAHPSYIQLPGDTAWAFGTEDFTIEWIQHRLPVTQYTDPTQFPRIFTIGNFRDASVAASIEGQDLRVWVETVNPNDNVVFDIAETTLNNWRHMAIVRQTGTMKVYKDGIVVSPSIGTSVPVDISNSTGNLLFGVDIGDGLPEITQLEGYMTNIRIVKGLAVYTGNFTPPTSNLALTGTAKTNIAEIPEGYTKLLLVLRPPEQIWVDASIVGSYSGSGNTVTSVGTASVSGIKTAAVTLVTDTEAGSVFNFSGVGSYIEFGNFNFGSKLTVMGWVKPTDKFNINALLANENSGNNSSLDGFKLGWNSFSTSNRYMIFEGKGSGASTGAAVMQNGVWQMIVYVLDTVEKTITFYYNGSQIGIVRALPAGLNMNTTKGFNIGSFSDEFYNMNARLGELRTYPDALNTKQVQQLYIETKGRYGL